METNCGRCCREAASGPARPSRRPPPRLAGHPPSAPAPASAVRAQRVVFRLLLVAGQSSLVWTSVLCTFVPLGVDRSRFHASAMANNPAVNLPRTRVCANPRFPSFGARAEGRNCWVLWQFRVLLCFVLFFFSPLAPVSPKLQTFLP